MSQLHSSLSKLISYIEKENFLGYDPYDTLTSPIPFGLFGKWGNILAIQFQKRNPINIRPLLGIKKSSNANSLALILQAYLLLSEKENTNKYNDTISRLYKEVLAAHTEGFHGYCWGYSFPWATSEKFLPAHAPNIVATAAAVRAIGLYHKHTQDPHAAEIIHSAAHFVMQDLKREENDAGAYFSYTPFRRDCVYNASLFAAEILAHSHALLNNDEYKRLALAAVDFVVHQQKDDGSWNYSMDLTSRKERVQIDFHQGYLLDSIHHITRDCNVREERYTKALQKGLQYYRTVQFHDNGRSVWRVPKEYPVDIHNQSQGIITFSKLSYLDPSLADFAQVIADYTIDHMQAKDGHFYYRLYRFCKHKTSYMRWSNAEMMVALSFAQRR